MLPTLLFMCVGRSQVQERKEILGDSDVTFPSYSEDTITEKQIKYTPKKTRDILEKNNYDDSPESSKKK